MLQYNLNNELVKLNKKKQELNTATDFLDDISNSPFLIKLREKIEQLKQTISETHKNLHTFNEELKIYYIKLETLNKA
jgi:uncharacterized protein involved in exopolysaccharide biosynthesis